MNWVINGKCFLILIPKSKQRRFIFQGNKVRTVFYHLSLMTIEFKTAEVHKHFGLLLDKKLDFSNHIDNKVNNCNEVIGIMKQLSLSISRDSLLTIYKTFVCPYLDYADEIIQCNTCLAIKGAIQGTNRDRIYAELGLQSLSTRIWYQKLHFFCFFFLQPT